MGKSKIITFISCLMISFCATNIANAQWVLPNPLTFNLSADTPAEIIDRLILWFLGLVVAIGILAIIWAGMIYVSSGGDAEQATNAKRTIKYALLGIIVAGISFAIVNVLVGTILA